MRKTFDESFKRKYMSNLWRSIETRARNNHDSTNSLYLDVQIKNYESKLEIGWPDVRIE